METLLIIILAAGIGIFHNSYKPARYALDMEDGSKTHIGHKKAKSKGGEPTLANLEPQDQFYNQSQGNK